MALDIKYEFTAENLFSKTKQNKTYFLTFGPEFFSEN